MAIALKHFGLAALLLAAPLGADRPKLAPIAQPKAFSALLECRQIADPQARLACFDAQTAVLADASEKRQIVVADRAEVEKTRKGLFGYALPVSPILGDDGEQEEAKRLETTVVSARRSRDGGWIIVLAGAGTWEQVDSKMLALSPRSGQKVVVTKGAIGSYWVSVDGQPALKMRRIQ
jgi:hypothetical protein